MSDVTLSPQAIALIGGMMTVLVTAIMGLCGGIAYLYRQVVMGRDLLLTAEKRINQEKDARLMDAWQEVDNLKIRVVGLEASNERLQKLAADATEGWREATETIRGMSRSTHGSS